VRTETFITQPKSTKFHRSQYVLQCQIL